MKSDVLRALVVDQDPQQGLILVQFLKDLLDTHYIRAVDVVTHAEKITPLIFILRFSSINQMQNIVREIRAHSVFFNSGIICIHENKEALFKEGADFVLTNVTDENTIDLDELYWMTYSLLRRLTAIKSAEVSILNYKLHPDTLEVVDGSKRIKVDPLQMKLLVSFAQHPERLLSREWFKNYVWQNQKISNRSIDAQISKLKKLLPPLDKVLESVYGKGYIYRHKAS